jgi:hypothetical protein
MIFNRCVPVFPLIPHNNNFVQRGFTERAACEERIPCDERRVTLYNLVIDFFTKFSPIGSQNYKFHKTLKL